MNKIPANAATPEQLQLAHALLQRKLRTVYIRQLLKNVPVYYLRESYRAIHKNEKPKSGLLPRIASMTKFHETCLPLSLFASLYRHASLSDIKTELDPYAILFAWDFFCQVYPNHIRERRPHGRIRPANFNEAWAIAIGLKTGVAKVQYCAKCHGDYLVIYESNFEPCCQICLLDESRNPAIELPVAYRFSRKK
jgi:hypothetical protein